MAKVLKSSIPYKAPETENLIELIKNGLRRNSDQELYVDSVSGSSWTGRELESVVCRVAKYLREECNFKKGDVCSIYSKENDRVAILILGIISIGGTANYLSDYWSGREVHDTACVMNSKFLLSNHQLLEKIKEDIADIEQSLCIVSIDSPSGTFKPDCKDMHKLFDKDSKETDLSFDDLCELVPIIPETDIAVIQFSSGTTGKPKPIPRTHKNLSHLVASVNHEELMDLRPGVVITGSLPITHRPGLWALLATIVCGNKFIIGADLTSVENVLKNIERFNVTILSSSLPFLAMLASQGVRIKDRYDTSTLKHIITSGAAIVNPEVPRRIVKEFELISLRQCFGMTESGWVFLIEQSNAAEMYLTVGHVVPGMEAIVLDRDTLKPVETNVRGEIALRGPQMFPGYLTDKQGVLNRSDFTEDGWFRIGDKGYYDENELIFIEGRYKEILILGNNSLVFPSEIEAIISENPTIEGVCVVKVMEEEREIGVDKARAFITLKHGCSISEEELIEFVQKKKPSIILEGGVRKIDKFPRLANGKIDRQTLARQP